jgi:hypothetical protein
MGEKEKLAMVYLLLGGFLLSLFLGGCAEVRLQTIPAPPPSAKLRVLVLPLTGSAPPGGWKDSHKEFARHQVGAIRNILRETGIYEMPTREEFHTVIGQQEFTNYEWRKDHSGLAKRVGKAVFADYVMFIERDFNAGVRFRQVELLNLETAKHFKVSLRVPMGGRYKEEWVQIGRLALREIFQEAKSDMLDTAMRKSQWSTGGIARPAAEGGKEPVAPSSRTPSKGPQKPPPLAEGGKEPVAPSLRTPSKGPQKPPPLAEGSKEPVAPSLRTPSKEPQKPAPLAPAVRQVDLEEALKERPAPGRALVAVYDFNTSEPLRVPALILSEALRAELFRQGYFTLVNRENMVQVLNEMGVQQTGLVDEKKAVQAGKGLAVQQIILGQFGALGKTLLLQVKRIDLVTQTTLSFGSLKCPLGKEDELLASLSQLARELAGR